MAAKTEIQRLLNENFNLQEEISKLKEERKNIRNLLFKFLGVEAIIDELKSDIEDVKYNVEKVDRRVDSHDSDIQDLYRRSHDHY